MEQERPDVREVIGRALLSTHLEAPEHGIGAVHRIAALARAPRMGSAEWRLKLSHDAASWEPTVVWLEARLEQNMKMPPRQPGQWRLRRCCEQALREWLMSLCESCNGAGEVMRRRLIRERCYPCQGSGERRWSTVERARALGCSVKALERGQMSDWINRAGRILRSADRKTAFKVCEQLGMRVR